MLVIAAAVIAVWWQPWKPSPRPTVELTPDAQIVDAPFDVTDAGAPPSDAVTVDVAPPPDAVVALDARVRLPSDATRIATPKPDAAAPAGPLRPITIGATPWAYFVIDGDPRQYETPMTLRLTVGSHRVTFTNPQLGVSRTVTVVVPFEGDARHVEKMN
jgi:hypothetical protein